MLFIKCVCVLKNGEADSSFMNQPHCCVCVVLFLCLLDFFVFIRLVRITPQASWNPDFAAPGSAAYSDYYYSSELSRYLYIYVS